MICLNGDASVGSQSHLLPALFNMQLLYDFKRIGHVGIAGEKQSQGLSMGQSYQLPALQLEPFIFTLI